MKKQTEFLLLFSMTMCLFACAEKHYNEWVESQGHKYYYNSQGQKIKSNSYFIDGNWYYFNNEGEMITDWYYINNKEEYVYLGDDGKSRIGWNNIDSNWYYFSPLGYMKKGWNKIDDKWYYFDVSNGKLKTSQWIDGTFYVNENGEMIHSGWHNIDGQMLYFESDGNVNLQRNYIQETQKQQKKQQKNSFSDIPTIKYIYNASYINSVFQKCVRYYDSVREGNSTDVFLLYSSIQELDSLLITSKAIDVWNMDSNKEKEYTLLNTVIVGMNTFSKRNMYR